MMSNRKTFLSGLAVAALAPVAAQADQGASPSPKPAATATPAGRGGFTFDRARFDRMTASQATYKSFAAATKIAGGRGIDVVSTVYDSYVNDLGEKPDNVVVGLVLYHGAPVVLGLNDSAWNEFVRPAIAKIIDADLHKDLTSLTSPHGNPADSMFADVAAYKPPIFICRWAFGGMVAKIAEALHRPKDQLYKALASSLLPNAMLVPSGVWAVAELQHRGFVYQQATT